LYHKTVYNQQSKLYIHDLSRLCYKVDIDTQFVSNHSITRDKTNRHHLHLVSTQVTYPTSRLPVMKIGSLLEEGRCTSGR